MTAPHPDTTPDSARLWRPHPALSGFVFAGIERNTHRLTLSHTQRFNYFPAAPLCAVTCMIAGQGFLTEPAAAHPEQGQALPRLSFSGPQTRPLVSWNPGPIHALTLGFLPDAWTALTGHSPEPFLNRTVPLDEVADGPLLRAFQMLQEERPPAERMAQLQSDLTLLWQIARPEGHVLSRHLGDWTKALVLRALTSRLGQSTRQIQRRIKAWTGLTQQQLHDLARNEALFAKVLAADEASLNMAQMADEAGFSDQSHMTRHVRRLTGLTPARLNKLIAEEEAFWCYRLLGERY